MLVTLLADIQALGLKGATVSVPEGYALNFLFPQHLAVQAPKGSLTDTEAVGNFKQRKLASQDSGDQALAAELDGLEVIIPTVVIKGRCRTPVGPTELRAALKTMGYKIPKNLLHIPTFERPGTHEVVIEFPSGFEAKLSLVIEELTK
jgi:large subunit ribosomal protein L9